MVVVGGFTRTGIGGWGCWGLCALLASSSGERHCLLDGRLRCITVLWPSFFRVKQWWIYACTLAPYCHRKKKNSANPNYWLWCIFQRRCVSSPVHSTLVSDQGIYINMKDSQSSSVRLIRYH